MKGRKWGRWEKKRVMKGGGGRRGEGDEDRRKKIYKLMKP